ncbi:MAG: hypothetical protein RI935_751 [Candidatus Parcubacteria bacterium]
MRLFEVFSNMSGRFAAALATFVAALALAACGGGGGSTTPPVVQPPVVVTPSGTITSVVTGTPTFGGTTTFGTVTYQTNAASTPFVSVNGVSGPSGLASGSITATFAVGTNSIVLYNGTTSLATRSIVVEALQPLRYNNKVFLAGSLGQLFQVEKANNTFTVTLTKNETPWKAGAIPLAEFWTSKAPLASGYVAMAAIDAPTRERHHLALNPITNTVTEYDEKVHGKLPQELVCNEPGTTKVIWICPVNHGWTDVQRSVSTGAPAGATMATKAAEGWYFTTTGSVLFLAGNDGVIIEVAKIPGAVRFLITFGN